MLYLTNAFSGSMLGDTPHGSIVFRWIDQEEVIAYLQKYDDFTSAVGHQGTAEVFSKRLGIEVKPNRLFVQLKGGDIVIVGQIMTRLPEGKILSAKELESIEIRWLLVLVF